MLYKSRSVSSPEDSYDLLKQFLGGVDRDYFIVVCSDRKISRQPLTYSRLNPPITD
ncbi:hypothetical protein [Oceanobacillus profundus]|uniref:hypothetical protein n=1 Tax=Oceanobacillus profundus TaxID=372463 RepID=UPI0036D22FB8